MVLLWVVGQEVSTPAGLGVAGLLTQIGLSGVFFWMAMRSEKRAERAEERERQLHADQVELLERLVPVLTAATEALDKVQTGMERQVEYARLDQSSPVGGLRSTLERITERLDVLDKRLPKPRGGGG